MTDKEPTYIGKNMHYMADKEVSYTGKEMPYMTVDKKPLKLGRRCLIRQRTRNPLTLGRRCLI